MQTIDPSDNIGGRDLPTTNGDRDRRRRLTRDPKWEFRACLVDRSRWESLCGASLAVRLRECV